MWSLRWGKGRFDGASKNEEGVMEIRSRNAHAFYRSRLAVPCAQCGVALTAPEWSEYLDDRRIRHLWSCQACGYEFETEVCYPAVQAA
jgi:hypothetical protein